MRENVITKTVSEMTIDELREMKNHYRSWEITWKNKAAQMAKEAVIFEEELRRRQYTTRLEPGGGEGS